MGAPELLEFVVFAATRTNMVQRGTSYDPRGMICVVVIDR